MLDTRDRIAFELSDDQRAVADLAREIAEREIAPHVAKWDREHAFPRDLYAKLTDAGLMGLTVPEAYGGAGADTVSYALVIEELARVDAGTAVTLSVHAMIAGAIARLGTQEQKERHLSRLATGNAIAGFALTEPDAGSDAAAIRATAHREGDGYVLRGRKQWCTNGSYASVVMAMFRTGSAGAKGISAFLIGALSTLSAGRIGIAAQAVGILAACLDASVKFARERDAFGKPIGAFEGVSFKIARMATDLDAARLLTYRAAALRDAGKSFAIEASKAKLFASTAARVHAAEAVQIHGGYGYTTEFPVERYYRDAKITEIYEGTSEIQHVIIARSLLGRLD
jgi:alkylation response protein AidB-like acyl-CoA dehydrogenase